MNIHVEKKQSTGPSVNKIEYGIMKTPVEKTKSKVDCNAITIQVRVYNETYAITPKLHATPCNNQN